MTSPLIEHLMRELRVSERELNMLIATAPNRYKVYTIPKRSGGRREIAHPATELKAVQRIIVRDFLSKLPVHHCATAYKAGSSIRENAQRHAHNRAILKYDFSEFFPSITERAWLTYCEKRELFSHEDAITLGRLLFRRAKGGRVLRLSIGAPSSPMLSNILMHEFDVAVAKKLERHNITYTRYADDMTFSAERTWNLREVDLILRSAINMTTSPRLVINHKKTVLVTPKYHRQITGLVLTLDGKVSLGRTRKRNIRSGIYHFAKGDLDRSAEVKLAGNLAFAKDVEPDFYLRMEKFYGNEVMDRLKQTVKGYKRVFTITG